MGPLPEEAVQAGQQAEPATGEQQGQDGRADADDLQQAPPGRRVGFFPLCAAVSVGASLDVMDCM